MKEKNNCRCCNGRKLLTYLKLGKQPPANSYHKGGKLPQYDLNVNVCANCFHSQLSVVVDKESMFENYLYVSGTTKTFRNHTKNLAKDAVGRFTKKRLAVLDIACNDGTQLEYFRALGCSVYGIDPAKNLRLLTEKKGIPVIVDYWTKKVAQKLNKKFDIITGTNVFAHVDNIGSFLDASKNSLSANGLLILEFPYADNMISHNEFDTVYHEHLSYFLVNSFSRLVERKDLLIVDILKTPIHGGSIRFFLTKNKGKHSPIVASLIQYEKEKGLLEVSSYTNFSKRIKKNKKEMKLLFKRLEGDGKKVIGYAASAKGNTMLNYFKIRPQYIVDDNPLKCGLLTPGMNIPIVPSSTLKEEKGRLYIIVLAWNFYNEIVERIEIMRPGKDDYGILYVPDVKVLPLGDNKNISVSA